MAPDQSNALAWVAAVGGLLAGVGSLVGFPALYLQIHSSKRDNAERRAERARDAAQVQLTADGGGRQIVITNGGQSVVSDIMASVDASVVEHNANGNIFSLNVSPKINRYRGAHGPYTLLAGASERIQVPDGLLKCDGTADRTVSVSLSLRDYRGRRWKVNASYAEGGHFSHGAPMPVIAPPLPWRSRHWRVARFIPRRRSAHPQFSLVLSGAKPVSYNPPSFYEHHPRTARFLFGSEQAERKYAPVWRPGSSDLGPPRAAMTDEHPNCPEPREVKYKHAVLWKYQSRPAQIFNNWCARWRGDPADPWPDARTPPDAPHSHGY